MTSQLLPVEGNQFWNNLLPTSKKFSTFAPKVRASSPPKQAKHVVFPSAPSQLWVCIIVIPCLPPCPIFQKISLTSHKDCPSWCAMPVFLTRAFHYSEICDLLISFSTLDLRAHEHRWKTSLPLPPLLPFQNKLYSFLLIFQPHEFQHVSIIPIKWCIKTSSSSCLFSPALASA